MENRHQAREQSGLVLLLGPEQDVLPQCCRSGPSNLDDDHVRLVLLHMARLDRGALMRSLAILVAALSIGVANADDSTAPAGIAQQPDYLIAKQGNADVWAIDVDAHLADAAQGSVRFHR